MGNLTSPDSNFDTSVALFDAQAAVTAQGNMEFGTVFNPTFQNMYDEYEGKPTLKYLGYSELTSVALTAVTGDLSLSGAFWKERRLGGIETLDDAARRVLPPIVSLQAGGNISLGSDRGGDFFLAPSRVGNLKVDAMGTISGLYTNVNGVPRRATLRLSDLKPEAVYGQPMSQYEVLDKLLVNETLESAHARTPVHLDDPTPSSVTATGDIRELFLISPEMITVAAGGDIKGLYFFGQNVHPSDVTSIRAGDDIILSSVTNPLRESTGFRLGGPGGFFVQAGDSLDLGNKRGIEMVGNSFYSALSEEDSSLVVMAGYYKDMTSQEIDSLFNETNVFSVMSFFNGFEDKETDTYTKGIKDYGVESSALVAEGDIEGTEAVVQNAEEKLINPFFEEYENGEGAIEMTSTSINTNAESSDIYIIAAGDLNVGLTRLQDPTEIETESEAAEAKETGIFTTKGGGISSFTFGDINVNESRIMTFRGGDILAWSHLENINAGRGSKTAINTGTPRVVSITEEIVDPDTGEEETVVIGKRIEWEPPSVGSGIRTLTYDPDGSLGPLIAPPAGDGYLFAPRGVIDAGEAGIDTQKLVLVATEVLNSDNIKSVVTAGVPLSTESSGDLGALSGVSNLTETNSLTEQMGDMQDARERMKEQAEEMAKAFSVKWLRVEFIGFDEDVGSDL
jgi:hypothetical protein